MDPLPPANPHDSTKPNDTQTRDTPMPVLDNPGVSVAFDELTNQILVTLHRDSTPNLCFTLDPERVPRLINSLMLARTIYKAAVAEKNEGACQHGDGLVAGERTMPLAPKGTKTNRGKVICYLMTPLDPRRVKLDQVFGEAAPLDHLQCESKPVELAPMVALQG